MPPEQRRRGRWLERGAGVLLGLLLGIGVVAAFVFLGSEGTIDSARLNGLPKRSPHTHTPTTPGVPRRIPAIRIHGGAPPAAGPASLVFQRGERARFRVLTDIPLTLEILGYGISRDVRAGTVISFRATRAGQFPVVVSFSHINVAVLHVRR